MSDLIRPRRALLSVSDKSGLEELGQELARRGIELVSTGGTAQALRSSGLDVKDVSALTGLPEMMDGRVKTLHPAIHGGLLAQRENPEHRRAMEEHGISSIDIAIINLYPFEATLARDAGYEEIVENIDIGGPAMLRAAAKNHQDVVIITDAVDYAALLEELDSTNNQTSFAFRRKMAGIAYGRAAAYDAIISDWFAQQEESKWPRRKLIALQQPQALRYGENPHQQAALYQRISPNPPASLHQIQGKELSYNNINDADAALKLLRDLHRSQSPACAIIKHANPCGAALGSTLGEAYQKAFECDQQSAFGGIVALNQTLDEATAKQITSIFTEIVIAPDASPEALEIFAAKPNLRLLIGEEAVFAAPSQEAFKQVGDGMLLQEADLEADIEAEWRVVTKRLPSEEERKDLAFAWKIARHVASNAIVFTKGQASIGIGAGQMSRIDSTRIASIKAEERSRALGEAAPKEHGFVAASDAFFPFADGVLAAINAGATALIQPGGAMRDEEVIAAADAAGIAMIFTGQRHFRH